MSNYSGLFGIYEPEKKSSQKKNLSRKKQDGKRRETVIVDDWPFVSTDRTSQPNDPHQPADQFADCPIIVRGVYCPSCSPEWRRRQDWLDRYPPREADAIDITASERYWFQEQHRRLMEAIHG